MPDLNRGWNACIQQHYQFRGQALLSRLKGRDDVVGVTIFQPVPHDHHAGLVASQ
jgi:hypothetical protein